MDKELRQLALRWLKHECQTRIVWYIFGIAVGFMLACELLSMIN